MSSSSQLQNHPSDTKNKSDSQSLHLSHNNKSKSIDGGFGAEASVHTLHSDSQNTDFVAGSQVSVDGPKLNYTAQTIKAKVWSPNIYYGQTLEEIKQQRTPAEIYRHKLDTVGRHARDMMRLEVRWSHNLPLWVSLTTKIYCIYCFLNRFFVY